jgi:hypothetical protein
MALGGVRAGRLVLGALTVATLAAAPVAAIVLWAATSQATGVRVYQSPPPGAAGDMARQYALGLLAKLKLPGGTQPAAWPAQPDRLPQPMLPYWPTNAVTAQALYRAGASMGPADWFLLGHVPAGMRPRWAYPANGNDRFVLDVPAHLPRGIAHASLAVVIIPHGGGSLIRAEVQVVWYPPRTAAEYVHPGRYRSVTVTVPAPSDASGNATVSRAFTAPAVPRLRLAPRAGRHAARAGGDRPAGRRARHPAQLATRARAGRRRGGVTLPAREANYRCEPDAINVAGIRLSLNARPLAVNWR